MKNKKGFTLIELMAVIILLGLIIMIIVPKITDSIENSKKNAAIDSALGYVKSARDYYNVNVLEKDYVIKEGINWIQDINSVIEVDEELPSSGYFYLENGKIEFAEFCVDKYYVTYEKSAATAVKTPDCLVDEVSEDFNPTSKYVSYVEGAKKAIIYRRDNEFDNISTLRNPPGSSTIVYFDEDDNIMNIYYGYTFNSPTEEDFGRYKDEIESIYDGKSWISENNIYQDEDISIIFLLEHNDYYEYSNVSECYLDYSESINSIILRLDNCIFAENVDFNNPYITLEF